MENIKYYIYKEREIKKIYVKKEKEEEKRRRWGNI